MQSLPTWISLSADTTSQCCPPRLRCGAVRLAKIRRFSDDYKQRNAMLDDCSQFVRLIADAAVVCDGDPASPPHVLQPGCVMVVVWEMMRSAMAPVLTPRLATTGRPKLICASMAIGRAAEELPLDENGYSRTGNFHSSHSTRARCAERMPQRHLPGGGELDQLAIPVDEQVSGVRAQFLA